MRFCILILFFFQSLQLTAAVTKEYTTQRTNVAPKIDGIADDEIWKSVKPTENFIQSLPFEGQAPSQRSEVKVLYDNTAIYVAAILYDSHPDSILHELGTRDDQNLNADYFRIGLDPYNLRQDAFVFEVSAAGVQGDFKFSDETFNTVWESAARITNTGWTAEIKIPYSAIRFPKKPVQEWGLQFARYIRRNREHDQWSLVPAGSSNTLLHWGSLKGIVNIESPLRLSLTPYASFYIDRSPDYVNETDYSYYNSTSYNFGADLKYGIDDRFTLDMTLLPDFGQVQSDNKVKNLSYQEIVYNENRTFFKESTELFSKNDLFYSRRIGKTPALFYAVPFLIGEGEVIDENPSQVKLINAMKLSGRTNKGLGIGFFNAITDKSEARIKNSNGEVREIITEPLTNYNVSVLDQQLKNNSNIYLINTNVLREGEADDANVTGTGFTFSNKQDSWATDGRFNVSQIFTRDANTAARQTLAGYNYFIGVRKSSGRFQAGISRTVSDKSYYPSDLGYFTINNFEHNRLYLQYYQFKPGKVFRESNIAMYADYATHHQTGNRTRFQLSLDGYAAFLNYHSIFGGFGINPTRNYDYNEPRVPGRFAKSIKYYYSYAGISSDYRKALAIDFTLNVSNFIEHFVAEGYNYNLTLRYRFSDKFTLRFTNAYNYDPYNLGAIDWYTFPDTIYYGLRKLNTYENILSAKYIFKNDMSLSLNARHYWITGKYRKYLYLEQDGEFTDAPEYYASNPQGYNFNFNVFNIDLIYSWQFSPGSFMTIAYKNAIETNSSNVTVNLADDFKNTLKAPQTNSISIKLIYYLDYLYLRKKG